MIRSSSLQPSAREHGEALPSVSYTPPDAGSPVPHRPRRRLLPHRPHPHCLAQRAVDLTLRTIEHAATGHGLRWNVSERVQVFDHPLWMLLLLAGRSVTGESYFTTFVISLALSSATAVLVLGSARGPKGSCSRRSLLSLSWALVTYSTSGLEGPLAHLLVVLFCIEWLSGARGSRRVHAVGVLAGLAAVTQFATLLITGPALISAVVRRRSDIDRHPKIDGFTEGGVGPGGRGVRPAHRNGPTEIGFGATVWPYTDSNGRTLGRWPTLLWAAAPLLVWAVFATFYYGTPVPMPVVAEWTERARPAARLQAAARLSAFAVRNDPITLAIIVVAVAAGFREGRRTRLLAAGTLAYGIVLALWAGDGMPGRWLALPCLVSTLIIVRHPLVERPRVVAASMAAAVVLAAVPALIPLRSDIRFGTAAVRRCPRSTHSRLPRHRLAARHPPVVSAAPPRGDTWWGGLAGHEPGEASPHPAFFGFAAGYGVHVIDPTGRTDPLLARLRPADGTAFPAAATRRIPDGYEGSLPDKENAIADPMLATYYDRVRLVTRASLWDPSRMAAALRLALTRRPEAPSRPRAALGDCATDAVRR